MGEQAAEKHNGPRYDETRSNVPRNSVARSFHALNWCNDFVTHPPNA